MHFVKKKNITKIAYAASFGVDTWEYSETATKQCREWVKEFKAVSVREASGVALCENYLSVNAIHVLDPTLLLTKDIYENLCLSIKPMCNEPFLVAYILDLTDEKVCLVNNIAKSKGLKCLIVSAEKNISITVEQWLSMFRDAEYVVTDSFHGTVFSLIFRKSFNAIINSERGSSRFESLLSIFNLQNRLIYDKDESVEPKEIVWKPIEEILSQWTEKSINFLETNICV